jgi:hypothetical protein
MGFVCPIAERVLVGLYDDADSIAAAVGSLEVEPHTIAISNYAHGVGRIPDHSELEVSTHPGPHGLQDGAANHALAQARTARQL